MRYGVISDIHGNLEALDCAIEALSCEKIDRYICVGDIVGYGANPRECIAKTKALNPIIVCGNHDIASSGLIDTLRFSKEAEEAIMWTRRNINDEDVLFLKNLGLLFMDKHFMLVHGTLQEPEKFHYMFTPVTAYETFELMEKNLCFIGHSHIPGIFSYRNRRVDYFYKEKTKISRNEKLIVNVGSVGQPRDGDPRLCYCVYDSSNASLEIKRFPYNVEKAQKKIIEAGLPPFLAHRLKVGM